MPRRRPSPPASSTRIHALRNLSVLQNPQELLSHILKAAVKMTSASSGSLMLLNPNTGALDIEATVGLGAKARRLKLRVGEGVTGWVASTGKPCRVDDVQEERRYVPVDPDIRSELAVPLYYQDQVIGILNVDSTRRAAFDEDLEKSLLSLAASASEWIVHAWRLHQLQDRSAQLEALVDIGQTVLSQEDLDSTLAQLARQARRIMEAKLSSLMLLSDDGEKLILKAWDGASRAYIKKPNLPVNESLVGVVVKRNKPLAVLNVQEHQQFQHTELARREGLVSLLCVPLAFQNKPMGVLSVYTEELHRFSNEEIRLLSALAGMSSVAIAKARLLEHVLKVEENLRATERLSALGWLAAEVAHEIRNPLTVMQMLFHSLVANRQLDAGAGRDAELIENKMRQMNRILDQVLTFARNSEPVLEEVDARGILEDILLLVRHKLAESKIEVRIKLPEEPLLLQADQTQLEQALLNLILNASQAMPNGGTLTVAGKRKDDTIVILVKDTGQGMSAKMQEDLFQPFISHRRGGTGLGMVLVDKAIRNHKGEIKIKSRRGHGTTFELFLPVKAL